METKQLRARANIIYLLMVVFAAAIAVKLFTIQLLEGDKWRAKAEQVSTTYRTVQPDRGHIYSEDGRLLATSVPEYDVRMDMAADALTDELFNAHVDSLAWHLAQLFGDRTAADYERDLQQARARRERYHLVKRKADHTQVQQLRTFPLYRLGRYKSGLVTEKRTVRVRPFGRLAARTVGYVLRDSNMVGLEAGYDKWLKGTTGRRLERRLAGGVWMPVDNGEGVDPVPGTDIHTTIDLNLQDVAHAALERQLQKHGAQYGCVVVMEVATGKIKAISNLMKSSDSTYTEGLNHAIAEATEPGSTFKLASLLVGIEDGLIDPADTVNTNGGKVRFRDRWMHDSHEGGYGRISVERAFEVSSNTGISLAVTKAYGDKPKQFIEGLRRWISIGYETLFTPLQILTFYNAVANDGRMMQPYLVDRVSRNGRTVKSFEPVVLNERIASKRTLEVARRMLVNVVDTGTATNLKGAHFSIAGKTGTAQIARQGGYKQNGVSYQASFAGYFPADAPKYSCIVVVNGPTMSGYYGNVVAGPIFKEIADKIYSNRLELQQPTQLAAVDQRRMPVSLSGHAGDLRVALEGLGLPVQVQGDAQWVTTQAADSAVVLAPRGIPDASLERVPNVLGMGLKDALFLLENAGLRVRVAGNGMVKRQSIQPGSNARTGTTILIELA
ncbi:MAG: transpeptidase family protein [Flavobacteriales bacterium]|nr:transpeptidase family protein [Flavobacteriales bacterium]